LEGPHRISVGKVCEVADFSNTDPLRPFKELVIVAQPFAPVTNAKHIERAAPQRLTKLCHDISLASFGRKNIDRMTRLQNLQWQIGESFLQPKHAALFMDEL